MKTGYNWRNTLTHFAAISGVLAGFCVTFIALILGVPVANVNIYTLTFGQIAVLLFGISASLFICAAELFLHAKEFDVYDIPQEYQKLLKDEVIGQGKKWTEFVKESIEHCRREETFGRWLYNYAVIIIFIGLFFTICPYNPVIAIAVAGLGIVLQLLQILR